MQSHPGVLTAWSLSIATGSWQHQIHRKSWVSAEHHIERTQWCGCMWSDIVGVHYIIQEFRPATLLLRRQAPQQVMHGPVEAFHHAIALRMVGCRPWLLDAIVLTLSVRFGFCRYERNLSVPPEPRGSIKRVCWFLSWQITRSRPNRTEKPRSFIKIKANGGEMRCSSCDRYCFL